MLHHLQSITADENNPHKELSGGRREQPTSQLEVKQTEITCSPTALFYLKSDFPAAFIMGKYTVSPLKCFGQKGSSEAERLSELLLAC